MIKSQFPNNEFYAWDVVNEAWKNDGTPRNGGSTQENPENSPWVKIFGDNSFIKYAFQFAKKYGIEGCKYFYILFLSILPNKNDKYYFKIYSIIYLKTREIVILNKVMIIMNI